MEGMAARLLMFTSTSGRSSGFWAKFLQVDRGGHTGKESASVTARVNREPMARRLVAASSGSRLSPFLKKVRLNRFSAGRQR